MTTIHSTCPYCGVGCGVEITAGDEHQRLRIVGDRAHPANFGRLCLKGARLAETLGIEGRLLHPEINGRTVSWNAALEATAQKLVQTIRDHGPDSVAFYVSGQLLTEDYYVANKLMKGFIGSANIDTNSRLCMSTAVAAHNRCFGEDIVPGNYEDLEIADLLVLVGSNMAWTHPVLHQRIEAARERRSGMRLIVIDPRETATTIGSDLHIAINPGRDAELFEGLLAFLERDGHLNHAWIASHTQGFDETLAACAEAHPDLATTARLCGVPTEDLRTFFNAFAQTPRTITAFSQGVNQSSRGVRTAEAILHVHLALGRIGTPGSGPMSITGQPNAMGGREVGGLATQLAAHMQIDNPEHRDLTGRFWGSSKVASRPGLKAVDLFEAVAAGQVRFIWIMATNPVVSLPESDRIREALASCPCVVVSDCIRDTDTNQLAHIRLPAAAWGEKNGTVTNSERRISRQRPFLPLPGEARPDWWIIAEVARRMGLEKEFTWTGPAAVFREHAALSAFENHGNRVFNLGELRYLSDQNYDDLEPVQWPVRNGKGTARLLGTGQFPTENGRFQFRVNTAFHDPIHTHSGYSLLLNTGRSRDQWHTMTRTGRSESLQKHMPCPTITLHPDDLQSLQIFAGDVVRVTSAHGECVVLAASDASLRRGQAFMPIHWNQTVSSAARVNGLVASMTDPISGQPAFKQTAVHVAKVLCALHGVVMTEQTIDLSAFCFWSRRRLGALNVYQVALRDPKSCTDLIHALGLRVDSIATLEDSAHESLRILGIRDEQRVFWMALSREWPGIDEDWVRSEMASGSTPARALLRGRPRQGAATSALVCSCEHVHMARIQQAVADGCKTLREVGDLTGAGTGCGSCRPELRRLVSLRA